MRTVDDNLAAPHSSFWKGEGKVRTCSAADPLCSPPAHARLTSNFNQIGRCSVDART
jgi:hypothetical protein